MKKMSEPIVFFGSGPVAAASLRLLAQDFSIEGVVTKPRLPHHQGDVPVLTTAEELGIKVYTAANKSALDTLFAGKPVTSNLGVLIDFGIIVSQAVIDYFPLGIVNSHFSLLPEWRGADPITFAILSGQKKTGVSLMLLVEKMDEGPLLGQTPYEMPADITTPALTQELITLSYKALNRALPDYISGKLTPYPQDGTEQATYSRRLTKDDGTLDWRKPALQLEREIRAFIEWPKSHAAFSGTAVIITAAHVIEVSGAPGSTAVVDKLPVVYCGAQALAIDMLKPAGKQEMTGQAFLAGYKKLFLGNSSS